jgi:hypothetical protein
LYVKVICNEKLKKYIKKMLNGNDGEKKNKRTFKGKSLSMIEIEMMNQKIYLNKNAYDIEMAKGRERPRVIKNLSKGKIHQG